MSSRKTDNSHLLAKVNLRLNHLPDKEVIYVLDAFCGSGKIWSKIMDISDKQFKVLAIDKNPADNVDIVCNNLKVLAGIDLSRFDIIDLDAYGCPYAQMQILFNHEYRGRVFVTFIQSVMGNLPRELLLRSGYTPAMLAKAQTIFTKKPLKILDNYLFMNNITEYSIKSLDRKHYLYFNAHQIKEVLK